MITLATLSILTGLITVTDGDTIRVGSTAVRLWGIQAPELHECRVWGENGRCKEWVRLAEGEPATTALAGLTTGKQARCELNGKRSYSRVVGKCFIQVGGHEIDLAVWMIEAGHAKQWCRYSKGAYDDVALKVGSRICKK